MDKELIDIIESSMERMPIGVEPTPYEVLFKPTKDREAEIFSRGEAIDIKYYCPECEKERAVTWIFPDSDMIYRDECCKVIVNFPARGEESD